MSELILALVLGGAFGFVLQRIGAADPDKILGMLTLTDLHLMKAILGAIGLSSALLLLGLSMGWINPAHLSIKGSYLGVVYGGLLLGAGWGLAGFCPGTALVASGAGRRDGGWFVVGGLLGAALFTVTYTYLPATWFQPILGGKAVLAGPEKGIVLGLIIAVCMLMLAWFLPARLQR